VQGAQQVAAGALAFRAALLGNQLVQLVLQRAERACKLAEPFVVHEARAGGRRQVEKGRIEDAREHALRPRWVPEALQ